MVEYLSKESLKILNTLDKQNKRFIKGTEESPKISIFKLKEMTCEDVYMANYIRNLEYLLEEGLIYNTLVNYKESIWVSNKIINENNYFILGENGKVFLSKKRTRYLYKVIPIVISLISTLIALLTLLLKYLNVV